MLGSNISSSLIEEQFGKHRHLIVIRHHWVLPEIKHCITGVDCLLYLSEDFTLSVLQNHGYVGQLRVLSDCEDFGAALQNDLQKLMGYDT
jgi:hypothetical protein